MINRAVIYCRVSTQEQAQKDALEVQVKEAVQVCQEMGWTLVDRYVEMETATVAEARSEYMRLISDIHTNKFDIIIVKSQDRINRNTKNWYLLIDEIVSNDKQLYLYMEHEFYRPDNNLLTGIKAILAEQYSRDLSKKINNAHTYRQKNGTTVLITNHTYGLRKNPDKSVTIIPEEAEVVRRMYALIAQGYGSRSVSILLYKEGITNRNGKQITETTIRRIIRNPLFKGTAVMNRTHFDFEKKKTLKNPESEWIYHPNMVPAIVDDELWSQANRMMDLNRRAASPGKPRKRGKTVPYEFSGKICCGNCGAVYYKTFRRRYSNQEEIIVEWKCSNYLRNGRKNRNCRSRIRKVAREDTEGCDNIHLSQEGLVHMVDDLSRSMFGAAAENSLIHEIMAVLKDVLVDADAGGAKELLQKSLAEIRRKKEVLLDKLLDGIVSDEDYQKKLEGFQRKEEQLEKKLQEETNKAWADQQACSRLEEIHQKLRAGGSRRILSELVLSAIRTILVFEDRLEIAINPGVFDDLPGQSSVDVSACQRSVDVRDYFQRKKADKERKQALMLEYLKEDRAITVKKLAGKLEISVSMARRWMEELRKNQAVYFDGKGGRGKWVVREKDTHSYHFPLPDCLTSTPGSHK